MRGWTKSAMCFDAGKIHNFCFFLPVRCWEFFKWLPLGFICMLFYREAMAWWRVVFDSNTTWSMPVSSPSPSHLLCQHVCTALPWTRARSCSGFQSALPSLYDIWPLSKMWMNFRRPTTVRKCAHVGISCAGCELVSWSAWKQRIFPSRAFPISAFTCLGDVVSVGWGYNCQGIHSLFKRSLGGFGMRTVKIIHPIILKKCLEKCFTQKSKCL